MSAATAAHLPAVIEPENPDFARQDAGIDTVLEAIERFNRQRRAVAWVGPRQPAKAFTVASLRGNGLAPAPIAHAEFAGGETIRMSFWQHKAKPWRVKEIRGWLCQIIGNERGRCSGTHLAAMDNLLRKIAAARALSINPGATDDERAAAERAMTRLRKRQQREAQAAVINASNILTKVYESAADLTRFWVEHDGKVIDPAQIEGKQKRLRAPVVREVEVTPSTPRPDPEKAPTRTRGAPRTPVEASAGTRSRRGTDTLARLEAELGPEAVDNFLGVAEEFLAGKYRAHRTVAHPKFTYRVVFRQMGKKEAA
jgi:hypothetical protein